MKFSLIKAQSRDLTQGPIAKTILLFSAPMIAGNLLQQLYNVVDTLIVGHFIGPDALASVGASYALMVFLTSILLGLCMGSGVVFSMRYGAGEMEELKNSLFVSFVFVGAITCLIMAGSFLLLGPIIRLLQIPADIRDMTRDYLRVIFFGIGFTFLYNCLSSFLRGIGNSAVPLMFLAVSALLNIVLDLFFVVGLSMGVAGAALATVIAQGVSALSLILYCAARVPLMRLSRRHMRFERGMLKEISQFSLLTCAQQSVMNFGILMIQGLVNSFGVTVMAAFAAAVKIDSFAYMPVQDFGNAFSTYIAQNFGAKKEKRIRDGIRCAIGISFGFCLAITAGVCLFAAPLMTLFVDPAETEIIAVGVQYLRIEGACYCGIGCLFLLYGLYRGMGKPFMSLVLTVISLGTRVGLAYLLAPIPAIGLPGIWWAIPIGWFLADAVGLICYRRLYPGARP